MKKLLSLFMACVMIMSCFATYCSAAGTGDLSDILYSDESIAASGSALQNFTVKNLPGSFNSLEELKTAENGKYWKTTNLMGIDLEFLYSADSPLIWGNLDVFVKDQYDNFVFGTDGMPIKTITLDDIELAFTNIGVYLQRVLYDIYGGLNLYTLENAIAMANFIGNLFYTDFVTLDAKNFTGYFGNKVPSANEFFRAVTALSGLNVIIDYNWVTRGKAFCEPIANILGGGYISFVDEYYTDGLLLGSKILEGMVTKLLTVGPVDFIMDLLNVYTSSSFETIYRAPTLALFTQKISSLGDRITVEELNTFDGILKLIFCDCDLISTNGCPLNSELHFCPLKFPVERYRSTADKNERFIYLYYYLNLAGRYRDNNAYFTTLKNSLEKNANISDEDEKKLSALIDGFFLGDFSSAIENAIIPLYKENISTATDSITQRMKNALMVFLKKIADYFDYLRKIFTGELEYGQGNSPFN